MKPPGKKMLGCIALGLVTLVASAQWSNPADDIPAYNALAPAHPLPAILSGSQLTGEYFAPSLSSRRVQDGREDSRRAAQQPCYCRCDREMGHNSLHSCFEATHGAACSTCMKEAVYSYQQTKKGKTPGQIRAGIEHGEWMNIDLEKAAL